LGALGPGPPGPLDKTALVSSCARPPSRIRDMQHVDPLWMRRPAPWAHAFQGRANSEPRSETRRAAAESRVLGEMAASPLPTR